MYWISFSPPELFVKKEFTLKLEKVETLFVERRRDDLLVVVVL